MDKSSVDDAEDVRMMPTQQMLQNPYIAYRLYQTP